VTPYYADADVALYLGDQRELVPQLDADFGLAILDPPFDQWSDCQKIDVPTVMAFTNPQRRTTVEAIYGRPRFELVWHFRDAARWVSHSGPRQSHELILTYGPTGHAYVGPYNTDRTPQNKGRGSVGRDKLPERIYVPRERKQLNSVLQYPRNVAAALGAWSKPLPLITTLLEWADADVILDPFTGSGTVLVAAKDLGRRAVGIEINEAHAEIAARRLQARHEEGLVHA
jgi:site-specific DNA-methyltransferase (adenine-specific)